MARVGGGCRVFFSNVPFTTTQQTLHQVFSSAGTVSDMQLFQGAKGFRGMGVCTFATPEEAQYAITSLRDVDVDGRPLWTSADTGSHADQPLPRTLPQVPVQQLPRQMPIMQPSFPMQRMKPSARVEPTEVFFSNVPFTTTKEDLLRIFAEAGEILELRLFDKNGTSRGMGVVQFAAPESVQWAVKSLRERDVDGRPMWVATHSKDGASPLISPPMLGTNRVFFSNVPFAVDESVLRSLFEEAGRVIELDLFRDKDGQSSRGMGRCTFEAPSMAAAAVRTLRDRDVGGRPIWVAEDTSGGMAAAPSMVLRPQPLRSVMQAQLMRTQPLQAQTRLQQFNSLPAAYAPARWAIKGARPQPYR